MPRTGRVLVPNHAHHIVQRGHNHQVVFAEHHDYQYYLDTLTQWKMKLGIKVYAWCLMTNHVHMILEPPEEVEKLGQLMKRLAGRQTRYVNRQEGRHGTLWEGRYKSSPIQTESYLLACLRYVELNPVRARIVAEPGNYLWSSYQPRISGNSSGRLDEHPCYTVLARSPEVRAKLYEDFLRCAVPKSELNMIRSSLQRGQLTGNNKFVNEVEQIIGRRIEHRSPGNQPRAPRLK